MDGLTAADYGLIGSIESEARRVWREQGVDIYSALAAKASKRLEAATTRACSVNPKGGRRCAHDEKLYRQRRPANEVLMPHGLEGWPAREIVSYHG